MKLYDIDLQAAFNSAKLPFYSVPFYFIAPEYLSQKLLSEKSDVWSIGVILSLLISGMPPQHSLGLKANSIIRSEFTGEIDFSHK